MDPILQTKPISLKSLRIGDFNIASWAFLAFFIYQYLFPQYFFPILFSLHIPIICVSICLVFAVIGWEISLVRDSLPVICCLILIGIIFFMARFFVEDPLSTKYYFDEHYHELAICLVMLYYFRDTNKINLLIAGLILFTTFEAFIAIKEGGLIWGHDFLQDENQISALMSMIIPITIFYSLTLKSTLLKLMCYLAVAVHLSEIVVSLSRGGFVALVSIGLSMLIFTKKKLLFIILIAIAVGGILMFSPDRFFAEMGTLGEGTQEATAHARTEYWRRARVMFSESPLVGKGIGQFPVLSHNYTLPGKTLDEGDYLVCHSNWFQILSELGMLGVILYLIIFYQFFKASNLIVRKYKVYGENLLGTVEYSFYRNITIGIAIGMIGFMVAGSFINIIIFPYFYTYLFLMMLVKSTFLDKIRSIEEYLKNTEAQKA
jgi:hypothetical protein